MDKATGFVKLVNATKQRLTKKLLKKEEAKQKHREENPDDLVSDDEPDALRLPTTDEEALAEQCLRCENFSCTVECLRCGVAYSEQFAVRHYECICLIVFKKHDGSHYLNCIACFMESDAANCAS
jgi:hypothetical protein